MLKLTGIFLSIILSLPSWAAETCSRVATINYQEVLVDVSSNKKGEGLRYYLEKDQASKELLDDYQKNIRPSWQSASVSTLGSGMILAGLLRSTEGTNEGFTSREFLLLGGLGLITLNYLVLITNEHHNERLLTQSIETYNKRNTPKIFFAPSGNKEGIGLGVGVGQEF